MTTAAAAGGRMPLAMHLAYKYLPWLQLATIPGEWAPRHSAWGWLAGPVTGVAMVSLMLHFIHGRRLCEPCIAEGPLDGPERGERGKGRLRAYHTGIPVLLLVLVGLLVWQLMVSDETMSNALGTASVLGCAALFWTTAWHGRLVPWCPVCNPRGDDGGWDRTPAPEPAGGMTR